MPSPAHKSFRTSLFNKKEFTLTFELVPNRGGRGEGQDRILAFAKEAAADGRLQAVSITENAGGHPTLAPDVLGKEIRKSGLDVINHFSCKDKNRNQIESLLFAWDREHFSNLLVLTGDYPQSGYNGHPKPVFDLGCIQTIDLISKMNQGGTGKPGEKPFHPTSFLKGVAVSPFKLLQSELTLQYLKLEKKIRAGADYIITQLGFDARKFDEIVRYLKVNGHKTPILGNIFIPSLKVAELMHNQEVPGCIVPRSLLDQMQQEAKADDGGKKARLLRAAKLLAILKGLGFDGAHIGGPGIYFSDLSYVIDQSAAFAKDWQQHIPDVSFWPEEGYYFFSKDKETGLNCNVPVFSDRDSQNSPSFNYNFSKFSHNLLFSPKGSLYKPMQQLCFSLEKHGFEKALDKFEYFFKILLFNCQNCGDCRIAELAFFCPQSGCAKFLLNGPCGGSINGYCEVYPNKRRCFYVKIYERLTKDELAETFAREVLPPRNWSRNQTSSWLNFFHDQITDTLKK